MACADETCSEGKTRYSCQKTNISFSDGPTFSEGRTKRERYLTYTLITTLGVIVTLTLVIAFYAVNYSSHDDGQDFKTEERGMPRTEALVRKKEAAIVGYRKIYDNKICLTKGCVIAAATLIQKLNESVDPCDDIYEYACGNYIKRTIIPDDDVAVYEFSEIADQINVNLRLVLDVPISDQDSRPTVLAKKLYRSCLATGTAQNGSVPLLKIISQLGGWPVLEGDSWNEGNFSWIEAMYTSRRIGFPTNLFLTVGVDVNLMNSTQRLIWIDQPSFILPREFLVLGTNDSTVQAYLRYSISIAQLLGANNSRAQKEMTEILDLQIEMAKLSASQEERRQLENIINVKTLKEMQELVPEIPWVDYVNGILFGPIKVDETEKINLADMKYITNFTKLLEKTPQRVIANLFLWNLFVQASEFLPDNIRRFQLELDVVMRGRVSLSPRYEKCIRIVQANLVYAVANMYIKNYFDENSKDQVEELVVHLRGTFEYILKKTAWMDDATRKEAITKLKAMKAYVGYADELLDDKVLTEYYSKLEIDERGILLNNILNISLFEYNNTVSQLRDPINQTSWMQRPNPVQVNAYYSFDQNSIELLAGILQGHFFQANRPKYMNYAAIGIVIGHEITHGFDDIGRNFDAIGNIRNWWAPDTEKQFQDRAQCMVEQYGSYEENGMKLNGNNTLGENIADNGGLRTAYLGYQNFVRNNGKEGKLPGLDHNTNQLFWISMAQVWCGKIRPQYIKSIILQDPHSLPKYRIIGPFSNSKEFAKDFNCPLGSKMNPIKKCQVW